MIRKLTLVAGLGAGYVLGAKAGRQRYEQIVTAFRQVAGMPAVQEVKSTLGDAANQLGDKAKATMNETVAAVADKVPDVVDLSGSGKAPAPAPTIAPGPMPGAAPSSTASEA